MICIKRNRSERFQSAAEVRDELNHFIQHSQPSQEPAIGVQNIVSDYRKGFLPKRNSGPTASKRKWFGSKDHIHKVSTFERVASIPETLASPVTGPLRIILGDSGSIFRRPSTMAFLIPLILLAVIALILSLIHI